MYTVYGIPNCDTVKKTRAWFEQHKIPYRFYDYKKEGISKAKILSWINQKNWPELLNQKSTTWKALEDKVRASVTNANSAAGLMEHHTSIIKRPVIEKGGKILTIGFSENHFQTLFLPHK